MGTQGTGIKGIGRRATLVALAMLCVWAATAASASAAAPAISNVTVSEVTSTSAVLKAKVNPQGIATSYHFEYGTANCFAKPNSCTSVPVPDEAIGNGTSPVDVAVPLSGLTRRRSITS